MSSKKYICKITGFTEFDENWSGDFFVYIENVYPEDDLQFLGTTAMVKKTIKDLKEGDLVIVKLVNLPSLTGTPYVVRLANASEIIQARKILRK